MKKKETKLIGWIIFLIGIVFILILFAKGFHFISIENDYFFAACIFIAICFPAIGARLIKKSKR